MEKNLNQINQNKSVLRNKILKKRNNLSESEIEKHSKKIAEIMFNEEAYQCATHILLFLSFGTEINTSYILNHALKNGKKVYAPTIIDFQTSYMEFYEITKNSLLVCSAKGIREPEIKKEYIYIPQNRTLCITPGIVFDEQRNRIGYGKGFYDLFFKTYSYDNIAICFDFQILKSFSTTYMDKSVDKIISERRII